MPHGKVGVITFRENAFLKVKLEGYKNNQKLFSTIAKLQNADSTEIINFTNVYAEAILAFRQENATSFSKTLVMFTHSWKSHGNGSNLKSMKKELKSLGVKIILIGLDEDLSVAELHEMVNENDLVYTSEGDDYHLVLPKKEPYIIDTICRGKIL